jgi:hypothetical protein
MYMKVTDSLLISLKYSFQLKMKQRINTLLENKRRLAIRLYVIAVAFGIIVNIGIVYAVSKRNGDQLGIINSFNFEKDVVQPAFCVVDSDCTVNSYCRQGTCLCNSGFITAPNFGFCAYQQKTELEAFLLSFFVGIFGADWFYLFVQGAPGSNGGYIVAGIFKLITRKPLSFLTKLFSWNPWHMGHD